MAPASPAFYQYKVQSLVAVGQDEQIMLGTVAEGTHYSLRVCYRCRFEFKEVDLELPGILAGKTFNVDDSRFQIVAVKAHCSYILDKPVVCVIAEFCEKGGKGISAGEELNILAGEFVVFFDHAPTSTFQYIKY